MDLVGSPAALRRWAVASLVGNMGIVVTGGLVRLTGSGLGCSTWPQCEPGSYVPHGDAPLHTYIEFGNRLLTFVLVAVAIGTLIAAWRARDAAGNPVRRVRVLALLAAAGIPAQAVIGGISVLARLEWWVVGLHLVPSLALIMVCTVLVHEVFGAAPAGATAAARNLAWVVLALGWLVLLLGIIVTGAGPNAGDADVHRSGFDLTAVARTHSLSVWAATIAIVALLWLARRTPALFRATLLLLGVVVLQGAIGYAQYFLGVPPMLVALHMLGTALFCAAIANVWWLARVPARNPSLMAYSG